MKGHVAYTRQVFVVHLAIRGVLATSYYSSLTIVIAFKKVKEGRLQRQITLTE